MVFIITIINNNNNSRIPVKMDDSYDSSDTCPSNFIMNSPYLLTFERPSATPTQHCQYRIRIGRAFHLNFSAKFGMPNLPSSLASPHPIFHTSGSDPMKMEGKTIDVRLLNLGDSF